MNSNGRITYRFDKRSGERVEQPPHEQPRASEADDARYFKEEMKFSPDIPAWNSPFQNDAHALEQLIREADGQMPKREPMTRARAYAEEIEPPYAPLAPEKAMPPFEADDTILLGDEGTEREMPLQPYAKRGAASPIIDMYPQIEVEEDLYGSRNKPGKRMSFDTRLAGSAKRPPQGPSWFKVFASVAGAIATGALFGYFVLTLFTGGTGSDSAGTTADSLPAASGTVTGGGKTAGAANGGKATDPGTEGGNPSSTGGAASAGGLPTVKVDVPAASYYMLQYGVFSTKDGLGAAAAELHGKGLAAASLTSKDDYRIYVGMSTDRDEAELLGRTLAGMDVYVKQIDVPALSGFAYGGAPADAQSFFEDTARLLAKLDEMTVAKLSGQSAADGEWQALHQQWTEAASKMETGMTDKTNKDTLHKLVQAVNTAAVAAGEYAKKPSEAYLWSMQTSLMNAVFIQKDWFASMESL
ncbi:SPOR domain-containing protein [Paenibacillus glycinis]|uniref:SPOR domain-containing protein n=1 Tax=Paenibacillus glycinis TaxID=2697035 RepID=A0ABW9XTB8_9BACL|nr:SPOR domain-containing protein [Paenibacillus glycinis]NBD25907.1 hypothetical protein [Paenibacillus glycinis]